jgi:hypothetical protein
MSNELPIAFKTLRTTRWHMTREIEGLDAEQMLVIPPGREDNIIWNIGHSLCSLSRLTYVFSGFPLPIPEEYLEIYGKGTSAKAWDANPDVAEALGLFNGLLDRIEADYRSGRFQEYKPLTIGPNDITSVEEAVAFHCFHEGLHIGMVITLKDLMRLPTRG